MSSQCSARASRACEGSPSDMKCPCPSISPHDGRPPASRRRVAGQRTSNFGIAADAHDAVAAGRACPAPDRIRVAMAAPSTTRFVRVVRGAAMPRQPQCHAATRIKSRVHAQSQSCSQPRASMPMAGAWTPQRNHARGPNDWHRCRMSDGPDGARRGIVILTDH